MQGGGGTVADDIDFDQDEDEDEGDSGATGAAALMCRVGSLGIRLQFRDSLAVAVALAEHCNTADCVGDHVVVHRDERGHLRTRPTADENPADLMARLRDGLRERRKLAHDRHRAIYLATQRRLGLESPAKATENPDSDHR
jgi:hypothetical protein